MIYFFTESYTYEDDVSITSDNGNDIAGHLPALVNDYDKDTYWENDGALPDLIIDLGVIQDIDSLWFKHDNIDTFELYYSDTGLALDWTLQADTNRSAESSSIFWQFDFTLRSKRYWKISVTAKLGGGNIKIYELMLMEQRLELTDETAPVMAVMTPQDVMGGSYEMADGSTKSYSGDVVHANIKMSFVYASEADRNNLYDLYSTPRLRPALVILPDDDFPENIFRCIWVSENFPFKHTIPYKGSGFSGDLEWQEY